MKLWKPLAGLLRPLYRRFLRTVPIADPWEEISVALPLQHYADGLVDDFPVYLRGPSGVSVSSVEDICAWLAGCTYQSDREQFGRQHWQHLIEFEQRRVGDCDDYALWAWRKLIELGFDARLVVGWCLPIEDRGAGHVWVLYRNAGVAYIFDGTALPDRMIRRFDEAKTEYRPEYAVNSRGERYSYAGAVLSLKELHGLPKHRSDAPTG
jgi:hypothetical protein